MHAALPAQPNGNTVAASFDPLELFPPHAATMMIKATRIRRGIKPRDRIKLVV
jgi:hypothetical protein